jgi:putative Mg2+ transporter-C (MgtC) family protein
MNMISDLSILGDLVFAALLGGAIGWEREVSGKSAGIRTHMLVALAAALFATLVYVSIETYPGVPSLRFDPTRAIEAVATGVGFLGGGIIFVSRHEDKVRGLTTAASVWSTAAVGLAVGMQRYVLAAGTTLLIYLVLRVMARFERVQANKTRILNGNAENTT